MLSPTQPLDLAPMRRTWALQYLACTAALNLAWEIIQLPLYTLWSESTLPAIAFAVVHCTIGDVLIAAFAIAFSWVLTGSKIWPRERYLSVAVVAVALGVTYTAFSEWSNTVVTRTWAYSSLMPTLWGIGLSPLAQWFIVPGFAFWYLKPNLKSEGPNL